MENIKVLFITGSGRSGSTLLERMLGQIDAFVSVGEIRHFWRQDYKAELCGCGRLFRECPFWTAVFTEAFGSRKINFPEILALRQKVDRIRYIPAMLSPWQTQSYKKDKKNYTDILIALYQAIKKVSGKEIIIDSSKDVSSYYLLSTLPEIDLHVIHLVRDSRAVAYSWQRKKVQPHVVNETSFMPVFSPRHSAWEWFYRNILAEAGKVRAQTYFRLRYKDIICEPTGSIKLVCKSLQLDTISLNFINENHVTLQQENHTVSGNPVRFQKGEIQLKLDNEWQEAMSKRDKQIVTAITWPFLLQYGFPVRKKKAKENPCEPKN